MDKKTRWLRIAYWTAAIADFVIAILVLIPARMGVTGYGYPMGLVSAVAFWYQTEPHVKYPELLANDKLIVHND